MKFERGDVVYNPHADLLAIVLSNDLYLSIEWMFIGAVAHYFGNQYNDLFILISKGDFK